MFVQAGEEKAVLGRGLIPAFSCLQEVVGKATLS